MKIGLVVLVGASGWLGRSIGPALLENNLVSQESLVCVNRSGPSVHYSEWPDIHWTCDFPVSSCAGDIVIFSLGAEEFRSGKFSCGDALVLSLMAGVGLQELKESTGSQNVIRAMPNAAVEFCKSYTPWVTAEGVGEAGKQEIRAILSVLGTEELLEKEHDIDVLTGLSGAGPAYNALLIRALARAATRLGLDSDVARRAALSTVRDTNDLLEPDRAAPEHVVRQFVDYDGVVAAALNAAIENGFDNAIEVAITAGIEKARSMSQPIPQAE